MTQVATEWPDGYGNGRQDSGSGSSGDIPKGCGEEDISFQEGQNSNKA